MSETKVKNIVFIMLDTLQHNYLGCYGNATVKTPHLDRFAREGILFENAYSEGLPTVPVRRALMTGRYTLPFAGQQPLNHDDTTLTDILWGHEVQTALVYDTPPMHLPKYGYSRGFDYVRFCPGQEKTRASDEGLPADSAALQPLDYTSPSMLYDDQGQLIDRASSDMLKELDAMLRLRQNWHSEDDHCVSVVCREAQRWLQDLRCKSSPFLLWVDSFDPHEPFDPPSVWNKTPCPYNPAWPGNPLVLAPKVPVEGRISDAECRHIRALYAESIEMVDRQVGKLLDTIREQGLWEETLIVITSDHGQPMGKGEHGHGLMRKCRPWPYEELVHVPLLLHIPGMDGGQKIKSFVQNVDIAPTILSALQLYTPSGEQDSGHGFPVYGCADMQGHNLLPLIAGKVDKVRDFAIAGYFGMSWSLISEDYSFIHWLPQEANPQNPQVPTHDELYDRHHDSFQLHNIITEQPEIAGKMLQELKTFMGGLQVA